MPVKRHLSANEDLKRELKAGLGSRRGVASLALEDLKRELKAVDG